MVYYLYYEHKKKFLQDDTQAKEIGWRAIFNYCMYVKKCEGILIW